MGATLFLWKWNKTGEHIIVKYTFPFTLSTCRCFNFMMFCILHQLRAIVAGKCTYVSLALLYFLSVTCLFSYKLTYIFSYNSQYFFLFHSFSKYLTV